MTTDLELENQRATHEQILSFMTGKSTIEDFQLYQITVKSELQKR
jgi:hypothetical protein